MKLFITGGTGLIGSHLLAQALDAGHEVRAIRRSESSLPVIPLTHQPQWIESDLKGIKIGDLSGCDTLLHLAAYGVQTVENAVWEKCIQTNVSDFQELMAKAIQAKIKNYVICGSCSEYGLSGLRYPEIPTDAPLEPTGAYHASKAAASAIAHAYAVQHSLQLAILRPFHVFGEGEAPQRLWPAIKKAALSGSNFPMTGGEQVRDFIHVSSAAAKFLEHAIYPRTLPGEPQVFHVSEGKPQTIRKFAEYWWQHWGASGKIQFGAVPYRQNEVMRYVAKV